MNLARLLGHAWPDVEVSGLTEHTDEIFEGCGFFAIAAKRAVAQEHGERALAGGAAIVISHHQLDLTAFYRHESLAVNRGAIAAEFYGHPAKQMQCIGVTGTNGKTSVAYYLASLSGLLGVDCGYIGTLGCGFLDDLQDPNMTTPNPTALQRNLASLLDNGCSRVVVEVSSHALDQKRADEMPFEIAIFTNLSREHLDYHDTMAAYGAAKTRLFSDFPVRTAVLRAAESLSETIAQATKARIIYYGPKEELGEASEASEAWCWWRSEESGSINWQSPKGEMSDRMTFLADFSVDNLTAALAALLELGHSIAELGSVVAKVASVPGRMEVVVADAVHGTVVVDYAHTPDALEKALTQLRARCLGRLICVVGCGGDRDQGKRPQMARAATTLADEVWLTSDNPRTERPESILADMQTGVSKDRPANVDLDRRQAIARALMSASEQDVVLIAGKGHEDYQEVGFEKLPFDDRAVARALLAEV